LNNIEYIIRIWPTGRLTMGCVHIRPVDGIAMFKAIEPYEYEGGVISGHIYGYIYPLDNLKRTHRIDHRLPTQIEIEIFKMCGSLENIEQKIRDYKLESLGI